MPSYAIVGNWFFLLGSLLFTIDAMMNVLEMCSLRSLIMLIASSLFTIGCLLFLAPTQEDSNQELEAE